MSLVKPVANTVGPVLIVGTGLLGTSIGLGLSEQGVTVYLTDTSPTALALAVDMGAGIEAAQTPKDVRLVIVSTPPDVAGSVIVDCLNRYPQALITDVASVKSKVLTDVAEKLVAREVAATQITRYFGSHPMAGRERSGAAFARSDLFVGRPWVLVPHENSTPEALMQIKNLALDLGALPVTMAAEEHDAAVALVSHVPQLISSALAARLTTAPVESLSLAGQGLRDVTRIARSDPKLWASIIAGNTAPICQVLRDFQKDLNKLVHALEYDSTSNNQATTPSYYAPGVIGAITETMHQGNLGVGRIPGKHGGAPRRYAEALVVIPDRPGQLGKLFTDIGELEVNIEDLKLEHSPGAAAGICQLLVEPAQLRPLAAGLQARGWKITSD